MRLGTYRRVASQQPRAWRFVLPLLLLVALAGCSNRTGGGNPFLAADRVPPPSTRALPAGAVQPYYQGQPLPVTPQAFPQQPVTQQPVTQQPFTPAPIGPAGVAPGAGYAPAASPQLGPPVGFPQGAYQATPQPTFATQAFSASGRVTQAGVEPPVGVPSDNLAARVAPPPVMPIPAASLGPAQPVPAAYAPAASLSQSQTWAVQPVAYHQLAPQAQPAAPPFSPAPQTSDGLPWNSGSAPRPAAVAAPATALAPAARPSAFAAPPPRIRLQGYPAPQLQPVAADARANIGRVQITELPPHQSQPHQPQPHQPPTLPTASAASAGYDDGFRPRRVGGLSQN
ncbi:MAG: hypothetical protein AAF790_02905 [Planctomycetota bacterium]